MIIRRNFSRALNERGVGLVEAAILLAFLFIVVFGIIDYGLFLRQAAAVSDAAGKAARLAAAYSAEGLYQCGSDADVGKDKPCADVSGAPNYKPASGDSVRVYAKKAACKYMKNAKLTLDEWNVNADTAMRTEDPLGLGVSIPVITVTIERNKNACVVCYRNMFATMKSLTASSEWFLEGSCNP